MKQRIVIFLLLVGMVFSNGCIVAEYSSNVRLAFGLIKEEPLPRLVNYNYPYIDNKKEEVKKEVEKKEEAEKPSKIVFAKFNN